MTNGTTFQLMHLLRLSIIAFFGLYASAIFAYNQGSFLFVAFAQDGEPAPVAGRIPVDAALLAESSSTQPAARPEMNGTSSFQFEADGLATDFGLNPFFQPTPGANSAASAFSAQPASAFTAPALDSVRTSIETTTP